MSAQRCALVTGATRGIGRAVVELLLARGRFVIACARDGDALAKLQRSAPDAVATVALDLAQQDAPDLLSAEVAKLGREVDELVYAAGVVQYSPITSTSEAELRAQLELNFVAPFRILQRFAATMAARQRGSMVAVASTLAERTAPSTAAYAASKAALISAVRSFALELAPHVRVNAVAPGVVETDMVRVPRRALEAGERREVVVDEQLAALRALHPLGRLGTADDIAAAVFYLLEASWATGTILTLDGGLTLR